MNSVSPIHISGKMPEAGAQKRAPKKSHKNTQPALRRRDEDVLIEEDVVASAASLSTTCSTTAAKDPAWPHITQSQTKRIMTLDEVLAQDVRSAAIHEAGHFVVADHYGLKCRIQLTNEVEHCKKDFLNYTLVKGQLFLPKSDRQFALCVSGWGGLLAEVAFDEDIASADLLEQTTLDLYHAGQLSVSGSDWDYIFSHRL